MGAKRRNQGTKEKTQQVKPEGKDSKSPSVPSDKPVTNGKRRKQGGPPLLPSIPVLPQPNKKHVHDREANMDYFDPESEGPLKGAVEVKEEEEPEKNKEGEVVLEATTGVEKEMLKDVLMSVVKIYCTFTRPNFSLPWQMERQATSTSSGFIIPGNRFILCNDHGVAYHSSVRVRKHGDSTKYVAKVLHQGHECDLALLTVEDDAFWNDLRPLEFGDVPNLQDQVFCVGYPTGGDNISVTQGIVSRVAVAKYTHANESLLAIQIDAAINAGNSGGPALKGSKVVGVAFETLDGAENIGYIIPVPVIMHFLADIAKHGKYMGFCGVGFHFQVIENKCMRRALGLDSNNDNGVLVARCSPLSEAGRAVQEEDVVLAIDGVPVASDGTVVFRDGERVAFSHLISSKYVGDKAVLSILRKGKKHDITVCLDKRVELVRSHMYDSTPPYYIYAGLVFTVLSCPFLVAEYGDKWGTKAPIDLCDKAFYGLATRPGEEIVIMNQVLISEVNIGYEDMQNAQVLKANGEQIYNLKQLANIIKSSKNQYLRLEVAKHLTIIVDTKLAAQLHKENLKANNIAVEAVLH